MADIFSKIERSKIMSRIRGSGGERTELAMVKFFRRNKITGWRRQSTIFGKPDFVFPAYRIALFVDGCFWHGCPKHATQPASNQNFWQTKLSGNKARDSLVTRTLIKQGWRVLRVWQHDLSSKNEANLLRRIMSAIRECPSGQACIIA